MNAPFESAESWISMEVDPLNINYLQPALFDLGEVGSGVLELFPKVWGALEKLVDPDARNRRAGLDCLIELNAARFSPLVVYLLTTRLQDPDLGIRGEITRILAGVLTLDEKGELSPEPVRQILSYHLSQMQREHIYKMLELVEADPISVTEVVPLFKACHDCGNYLSEILLDRRESLVIRKQAARLIGIVGYVDAIPCIDRVMSRLESRVNGQQHFPFGSLENGEEQGLLPILYSVLALLQAP